MNKYFLSSKIMRMAFMVLFLSCQMAAFSQSDTDYMDTSEHKSTRFQLYVGVGASKCSLKPIDGYEQVHIERIFVNDKYWGPYSYPGQITHIESRFSPRISLGLNIELGVGKRWGFMINPSFCFGGDRIIYDADVLVVYEPEQILSLSGKDKLIEQYYNWLEMPLLVKFSLNKKDRVFLVGGLNPRMLMMKQNPTQSWRPKSFDLAVEFGAGVRITKKTSVQIKMSLGLVNVLKAKWSGYSEILQEVKNNQIRIGFVF